ncbi:MAG TPA: GTP-binding protein, partial [Actinomycetota bacterium]|nr:GTP-binding protein [Actinomycetota bacterium]
MKAYEPSQIRNVALVGHGGAGKTMLAEALLYASGATTRSGRVEDGTATTDFEPEEHHHRISVSMGIAPVEWNGHKINLIDCPGYADFFGDVASALRVADACLFVVSAVDGVQVQTELIWDMAQDLGLPCLFVINKLDRERASFTRTMDQLRDAFGSKPFALDLPIGEEHSFTGLVDLLANQAFTYDRSSPKGSPTDIPGEMQDPVSEAHVQAVEAAAEGDDTLMEKYFEAGDLDEKEIAAGLSGAVAAGATAPVLVASATHLIGIDRLADAICSLVPSPLEREALVGTSKPGTGDDVTREPQPGQPMSAFVFKTISDPFVGKISIFRVFSGEMRPDHEAHNTTQGATERMHQLFYMVGKE